MAHTVMRHIVMWNVAGDRPQEKAEAIAAIRREFEALKGLIPGMLHLEIGITRAGYPMPATLCS